MQIKLKPTILLSFVILFLLAESCLKEPEALKGSSKIEITGTNVDTINANWAVVKSSANNSVYVTINDHGFCWGTSPSPDISGLYVSLGVLQESGSFSSKLSDLISATKYYIRSYAKDNYSTIYGSQSEFTTLDLAFPQVNTTDVTNITSNSAQSGGNVTAQGGTPVTTRGVCWNTSSNPIITNFHTSDGSGTGTYASSLSGLTQNTLYYIRAYATNSLGTAYGNEVTFTTLSPNPVLPTVTTTAVTNTTQTTANSGGNVTSDGGSTVTARGVCWSTSSNPTTTNSHTIDGVGIGVFVSSISGLTQNTLYNIRAYATNSLGTAYGNEVTFTTLSPNPVLPTVTTTAVTNTTQTTANSGGNVTSDGGSTVTARGVCWSTSSNPTTTNSHTIDGVGIGVFVSSISGLTQNTLYHVRAYATNSTGTAYGNDLDFTTSTTAFSIGQSYGGGIIFYIDGTSQHGLISATSDQSTGTHWGCLGTFISGTSTAIGTGQTNTTAIVNGCNEVGIAARICDNLVLNGYGDWFLPSLDELQQMYIQKNIIGNFSYGSYWSSSDYSIANAWKLGFDYGVPDNNTKLNNLGVRAIRAF